MTGGNRIRPQPILSCSIKSRDPGRSLNPSIRCRYGPFAAQDDPPNHLVSRLNLKSGLIGCRNATRLERGGTPYPRPQNERAQEIGPTRCAQAIPVLETVKIRSSGVAGVQELQNSGGRPTLGSSAHTELHRFRPEISWFLIHSTLQLTAIRCPPNS